MRWIDSVRQSQAADDGPAQAAPSRPDDAKAVWSAAKRLRAMVESVNRDEFYWQEAHYDRDSKQGRELLFLMANHEWVRATSEAVDITRSDAIETTIKIDIDLSQITHEAFRKRKGHVWLPVSVLPPQIGQIRFEPDLFATVTDAAGNAVPMLPAVDLRHQVAPAMAEIIAKMAVSHLPRTAEVQPRAEPGARQAQQQTGTQGEPIATRDQRLVLSAAIYRMLRSEPGDDAGSTWQASVSKTPRITRARDELLTILDYYTDRLERRFRAAEQEAESSGAAGDRDLPHDKAGWLTTSTLRSRVRPGAVTTARSADGGRHPGAAR